MRSPTALWISVGMQPRLRPDWPSFAVQHTQARWMVLGEDGQLCARGRGCLSSLVLSRRDGVPTVVRACGLPEQALHCRGIDFFAFCCFSLQVGNHLFYLSITRL